MYVSAYNMSSHTHIPTQIHSLILLIHLCRSKRRPAAECGHILANSLAEIPSAETDGSGTDEYTPAQIRWSDLTVDTTNPAHTIIGSGSFGVVIRGVLTVPDGGTEVCI